jgi:RNA polymerase sigma factor (TIGR02999 family)
LEIRSRVRYTSPYLSRLGSSRKRSFRFQQDIWSCNGVEGVREPAEMAQTVRLVVAGDRAAFDALFEAVYAELRRLAQSHLAAERPDHTLRATALVHEVYMRLVDVPLELRDRAHFMAVASRVMRRILVDHARRKLAAKRNPGRTVLALDEAITISPTHVGADLVALDRALSRLQAEQPEKAQVVEMRFFGGMTMEEIALVLGVTSRTVGRYWAYAQARLCQDMSGAG